MQNLIISILLVFLCITITLLILRRREIEKLTEKLREINDSETNEELRMGYPNSKIEDLIEEINKSLKINKKITEEYKKKDIELRQSIANISHDLRTPLTSIIGYIQLIQDEDITKKEKKQYISILESRSNNLKELISSFYDLSRLQADEYVIDCEWVSLSNILCDHIASFYSEFISKGLDPKIDIEENIPLVYGDKKAINRIFTNLIQNALKHAEGDLSIELKKEKNGVLIVFCNDASSLKKDDASRIFERFFTGDRMRTGQNTGLGLAITKVLVEKQGQKIWAEKEDNKLYIKLKWKQFKQRSYY